MSAALLIRQVGCFHPPMSMSYQPGGARCSHCGQQWIAGANAPTKWPAGAGKRTRND